MSSLDVDLQEKFTLNPYMQTTFLFFEIFIG